ncbi:uncharacterized protein VTP21DRAFT_5836 [Calcarisporiella thermophila]|uniref:uncharacterized protein n=1 Tax=Calcarisporiella thermophila TaxID=911321 RepID=UPI00374438C7
MAKYEDNINISDSDTVDNENIMENNSRDKTLDNHLGEYGRERIHGDTATAGKARDEKSSIMDEEKGPACVPGGSPEPPEGGYGWFIVLATFLSNFVVFGTTYCWSVYQQEYMVNLFQMQYSTLQVSFIGSLAAALLFSMGPFVAPLVTIIGVRWTMAIGTMLSTLGLLLASFSTQYWQLFLTQGVLFGIGSSISFFPPVTITQQWFKRRRGLAIGIAISGGGIGGLCLSNMIRRVINDVGYGWSLRVLALWTLIFLSIATLLTKPLYAIQRPARKSGEPSPFRRMFDFSIVDRKLLMLVFCGFFITFGYLAPFFMMVTNARFIGVSVNMSAALTGIMSGVNSIARIIIGMSADHFGRINTMFLCTVIAGVLSMALWPFANNLGSLMAFGILYGFFGGGYISLYPAVIADLVPPKDLGPAIGVIYFVNLFGNLFGTPIAGALFDITGHTSFLPLAEFCGAITIFSSLFILALRFMVDPNPFKKL